MLLSSILPKVARMHPDRPAMKAADGTVLSYAELLRRVNGVASELRRRGALPGDRIALLGDPSPSLAIAECAAVAIGAIPAAVFPGLTSREISQIIQDAAPAVLVYDAERPELAACASSLAVPQTISCRVVSDIPPDDDEAPHEALADDVALLIYTGGTTGRSKGVMHSHRSIRHWSFLNPSLGGGHNPEKKALVPNQAHLTGQFILWTTLYEGGCLIYADSYPLRAEQVIDYAVREELRFIGTVGLLFRDIVRLLAERGMRLPHVQGVSCGGTPFGEKTLRLAREAFPNAQLSEVYSQTESGQFLAYLSVNRELDDRAPHRLLSVGNPSLLAHWGQQPPEIRIVDEDCRDVPRGGIGEIVCKGPQLMLGYWNNSEETAKALKGGWLHTGDVARFDEDGYLYLLDRRKDIIIVSGSNVYGSEVEEALNGHPAIAEVAVVGAPSEDDGEEVVAVVVLRDGGTVSLEELRQRCEGLLARHKQPTRLVIADALARTSVGKLNKAEIRKPFWQGRDRMIN